MAEDEKKAVESEDEKNTAELADEDLEEVAGGVKKLFPESTTNVTTYMECN